MKLFRRKAAAPTQSIVLFSDKADGGDPDVDGLSEGWIACRIYVPANNMARAIGGVLIEFSPEGAVVVSSGALGRFDKSVELEFAGMARLIPCKIVARQAVHPRVTVFDLTFSAMPAECDELIRELTRRSLPYPPKTEVWMRHAA